MDLAKIRGAMQGSYPVRIEPYTLYGQSPPQGLEISFFFKYWKKGEGGLVIGNVLRESIFPSYFTI